jgi:predicted MFS family arabinose efflux permease
MSLQVLIFTASRLILYSGYRMVFPFLPAIARGLGVSLETVALAVTARSALGLAGPVLGSTGDTRGRKSAILLGLALFVCGMLLVTIWPTYVALFAGLMVSAAGSIIFDAAMQAYLGDNIDYSQRSLAIAVTEFGWSGAFLLGMPIIGWLIARSGWSAPFPWLAGLAVVAAVVVWRIMPFDRPSPDVRPSLVRNLKVILAHTPAVAALGVTFFLISANQVVNIIFGAWMENAFDLEVAELGAASSVIGLAGLAGVVLVATVSDRLGKRRAVGAGITLNILACLILPSMERSLNGALVALFVLYLSYEFSLISIVSLMTELVPEARATLMASNVAAMMAGEAFGAPLGPLLFKSGLLANCAAAIVFNLIAVTILSVFVRVDSALEPTGS